MRKKVVAGNWKMNITPSGAERLVSQLQEVIKNPDVDVILCVPSIDIIPVMKTIEGSGIKVGAENMYYEEKGAFTGELSPEMLTDAGVEYVIIGHSERRQYFREDDTMVNRKMRKAIEHNITPILCCGETIEQREAGVALDFLKEQITKAFEQVTAEQAKECIIAYEPIWAIGTGRVATTQQAQEACEAIRRDIAEMFDQNTADQIRILYGGSVNEKNALDIFEQPDIDGGLVGGASLKPEFASIINYNKAVTV